MVATVGEVVKTVVPDHIRIRFDWKCPGCGQQHMADECDFHDLSGTEVQCCWCRRFFTLEVPK